MGELEFLTLDEILRIHDEQLAAWGGLEGVRDPGALASAVAVPESGGSGIIYFHSDLFEMAAAYAFHIGEAQAFFDGNKRTAVDAALTFLALNGVLLEDARSALFDAMQAVANHTMTKAQLGELLRSARRVT